MVVKLEEVKDHLKIDSTEEDNYLKILISASEEFIKNGTGKDFDETNSLAKIVCLFLIADLYENRELSTSKLTEKVRSTASMLLTQLALS